MNSKEAKQYAQEQQQKKNAYKERIREYVNELVRPTKVVN